MKTKKHSSLIACLIMLACSLPVTAQKKIWGTLGGSIYYINPDGTEFVKALDQKPQDTFFGGMPKSLMQMSDGSIIALGDNGFAQDYASTVYKISSGGITKLHFWDYPGADFVIESDTKNLVGVGSGAVQNDNYRFTLKPDSTYSENRFSILNFVPKGGLTKAGNGSIYGLSAGDKDTRGYIYRVNDTSVTIVKYLSTKAGRTPDAKFIDGQDGFLYASAQKGGDFSHGTLFKMSVDEKRLLKIFDFDGINGSAPFGEMTMDGSGYFYGMTKTGGQYDKGVIFRINKDGTDFSVLHHFNNESGAGYLVIDKNVLYGQGFSGEDENGFLFSIHTDGSAYKRLFNFPVTFRGSTTPGDRLLIINTSPVPDVELKIPADGSIHINVAGIFSSAEISHAESYQLQLSLSPTFEVITNTFNSASNRFDVSGLNHSSHYYARVKTNVLPDYGPVTSFTTDAEKVIWGITRQEWGTGSGSIYHVNLDGSDFADYYRPAPGANTGSCPTALLAVKDGSIIAVTAGGGNNEAGTLIRITKEGLTKIHDWDTQPVDYTTQITEGNDGFIYGLRRHNGFNSGQIFKMKPDGSQLQTAEFSRYGFVPVGNIMQASNGAIYGLSNGSGPGWVYKIKSDFTGIEQIFTFSTPTGKKPEGALTEGPDGYLYGLNSQGGQHNFGTIFKISFDGAHFEKLHDFELTDGALPTGNLISDDAGNFYGATHYGGQFNKGVIFKIRFDGSAFTVLHHFSGSEGGNPPGYFVLMNDVLYGYTSSDQLANNYLFSLHTDGSDFVLLHNLFVPDTSEQPADRLLLLDQDMITQLARVYQPQNSFAALGDDSKSFVSLSPNPFASAFELEVHGQQKGLASVSVFDLQGKEVIKDKITSNEKYSLGSELSPGMYVLKVVKGEEVTLQRIIKH